MSSETYTYKGISAGKYIEGEIEALSQEEANFKLKEQKIIITNIVKTKKKAAAKDKKKKGGAFSFGKKAIKPEDVMIFSKQFATMVKAGLPILNVLSMLRDQIAHLEYQTSSKNIHIAYSDLESAEKVLVDPHQISIIFQNCLHNAIKFSKPNSQIHIWLSDEEEIYQKLHIKDFGIGIDAEKLEFVMDLKNVKRGRIKEYADKYGCEFHEGRPWSVNCDIALPCATQNELNEEEAKMLVDNGCMCVSEGANMPSTPEAIAVFQNAKILFAPGKASNAGGVATSGLEMSQNSIRMNWTREEVDEKLKQIMNDIHSSCVEYGKEGEYVDYVQGANIAGFVKVADAMLDQGLV